MEVGNLLLQGDDSTWKAADWHWDSQAFVAAPKHGLPDTSTCCKKRKTENLTGFPDAFAGSCGGCKAAELAPLSFLQQADNSTGSSRFANGALGSSFPKVEAPQHHSGSSMSEAVSLPRGPEGLCQADGCESDMAKQSVWHQKSRICDKHMSGMFLKLGKPQQFCQQCGRSHNLDAFDQGRKSCRTQLAKHAARRRKRNSAAVSKLQAEDTPLVTLAGPPVPTGCKAGASIAALAMQHGSSDAWLQTLCNNPQAAEGLLHAQPLDLNFRHSSGSSVHSMSNSTSFAHTRLPLQADEHTSFPAYDQPAVYAMGTECLHQANHNTQQPSCPSIWASETVAADQGVASAPLDDPLQDVLSWQLPPMGESHRPPMSGFDQALAFMQADSAGPHPAATCTPPHQQPAQQQTRMKPSGVSAALTDLNTSSATLGHMGFSSDSGQALPSYQGPSPAAQQQQPYTASIAAVRLSVKLFNCTPAQLPSNLRESVTGWLGSTPADVEGYIRPGCVHLTVQATVPAHSDAQSASQGDSEPQETPVPAAAVGVKQVVDHLLASSKQDIWHQSTMVVQLGSEVAVVHKGTPYKVCNIPTHAESDSAHEEEQQGKAEKPACCILAATRPSRLPVLAPAQPVCLVAGLNKEQAITLVGGGLSQDCKVLCRAGGKHLEVQVLETKVPSHKVQVMVPCNLTAGLLYLEVQRGSFMGPALPLLVAPTAALAAEAVSILQATPPSDQQGLTVDLGCAMLRLSLSNKLPRHQGGAVVVSEGIGSFEVINLLAILARAVSCGRAEMVRSLMSLLSQKDSHDIAKFRDASGMGLLHLAVRSGSLCILETLLEECSADDWQAGQSAGVLQDGIFGPAGITPFHLAAFLPDAQPVALLLCASLGAHHWFTTMTHDGHTPADFAVRCGSHSLTHAISKSLWKQASANRACWDEKPRDRQSTVQKETEQVCCQQPQSSASTCTGCWSDSSSDDSEDLDASQHGGSVMSVMPNPQQPFPVLSAATNFVRDSKERLASVIRKRWSPY